MDLRRFPVGPADNGRTMGDTVPTGEFDFPVAIFLSNKNFQSLNHANQLLDFQNEFKQLEFGMMNNLFMLNKRDQRGLRCYSFGTLSFSMNTPNK